ncbi:NAD(P)-dependent dehydrogenase, short-chain alcohol dehydrogenase family [Klenkia soli]|uniref:NAD(P)-dependent dehydrogenase, short-chain alcohol dehydrogenase family n=1 Tax=Klenkia soli TaxID=1052260 RepID=A0A1H0G1T6_9ACTN|nr:SDR family oxidoreductase [Klenkia soli]SDO00822.1 NAD(P)-dependent dehydrogenase, short-chain alcohol dehydrogenase family [Klenkia soli]
MSSALDLDETAGCVTAVGQASTAWAGQIAEAVADLRDGAWVLVLDTGPDAGLQADSWVDQVEQPSRDLLDQLARRGRSAQPGSITVLVRHGDLTEPLAVSLVAAVRGTVGTAALEYATHDIRVNTVLVSGTTTERDIARTVDYLSDDEAAGSVTGATFDLANGTQPKPSPAEAQPVLVTGAAGGLGRAAAEAFVAAGRSVVLTDRPGPALDAVAEALGAPAIACDVVSPESVAALAGHAELTGGISALVVHHGVGGSGSLAHMDRAIRDRSLTVNGTGVWNLVTGLDGLLTLGGPGSVVVLSSQAGLGAEPGNGPYCAAKFAVVGLVRALAAQTTGSGVRVHSLCPGPVDTPLMREAFAAMADAAGVTADEYMAQRLAGIPLGRVGTTGQIGAAARYLVDLDASGVVLASTGGAVLT